MPKNCTNLQNVDAAFPMAVLEVDNTSGYFGTRQCLSAKGAMIDGHALSVDVPFQIPSACATAM